MVEGGRRKEEGGRCEMGSETHPSCTTDPTGFERRHDIHTDAEIGDKAEKSAVKW